MLLRRIGKMRLFNIRPKVDAKIDIICSHTAPSFCFPTDKGSIVQEYSQYDNGIIKGYRRGRETVMDSGL